MKTCLSVKCGLRKKHRRKYMLLYFVYIGKNIFNVESRATTKSSRGYGKFGTVGGIIPGRW